ncbi:MAG: DUF3006 domain-containing protein [Candidatus Margulisiibacteriota bacterium]|nr:DUF3006 domain-containing protein [Candidatus Margulisiibacteriota bacterium]
MKQESKFKGVIDRIEEEFAVVFLNEDGEDFLEVPKKYMPKGCRESDVVSFKISAQKDRTLDAKKKVEKMLRDVETCGET